MIRYASALALAVLIAGPALADPAAASSDAPVTTKAKTPTAPIARPTTTVVRTARLIGPYPEDIDAPPAPDGKPHGYIEAAVGNHGTRVISGAMTAPLGDNGVVAIAIGAGQGR